MRQIVLAVGVAALCSAGLLAADDSVPVRITGCVLNGDGGSFILKDVQEMSDGRLSPTSSIYWLSTAKGLKQQVGRQVEVIGTFSPSRDQGKTGTITITPDAATGHETLKVENGAKSAAATDAAGSTDIVGTSGTTLEIRKPYRRLQVQKLTRIAERCTAP